MTSRSTTMLCTLRGRWSRDPFLSCVGLSVRCLVLVRVLVRAGSVEASFSTRATVRRLWTRAVRYCSDHRHRDRTNASDLDPLRSVYESREERHRKSPSAVGEELVMIDKSRCMAKQDGAPIGGPRCQAPATHETIMGRRCSRHAESLRRALRSPNVLGNVVLGRPRTEDEIKELVTELSS